MFTRARGNKLACFKKPLLSLVTAGQALLYTRPPLKLLNDVVNSVPKLARTISTHSNFHPC
jgi:hypothetical protein